MGGTVGVLGGFTPSKIDNKKQLPIFLGGTPPSVPKTQFHIF